MKFNIHHNPEKKTLEIPRAVLQISELAESEELVIHTERGCALLVRKDLSAAESVGVIALLTALNEVLIQRLAQASQDAVDGDSVTCGSCERLCPGLNIPLCLLEEADIDPNHGLESSVSQGKIVITAAEEDDPLDELDDDLLDMLDDAGVDLDGLRQLLEDEGMNNAYLYPYSSRTARERGELDLWRESYQANIACKAAIEGTIRQNFDGMYLDECCAASVIAEYGYKRTAFVLANTLKEKGWDGRFSQTNKLWAQALFVPPDQNHNSAFVVDSHPAVLDGFVNLYRKAYQALGLFASAQCEPNSWPELDYEGKVLVLSPDILKESCWQPENQLWYAHDGFGCRPHAIGRSIRCTCLGDGEVTRWNRADFVGVIKEKFLPEWAKEKLSELTAPTQSGPAMTEMCMK